MIRLLVCAVLTLLVPAVAEAQFLLKKSTAFNRPFVMIDSADHVSGKTGLTITCKISKDGADTGAPGGSITQVGSSNMPGHYYIAYSTTDTNTSGSLTAYCTATGADPVSFTDLVYDATNANSMFAVTLANTAGHGGASADVTFKNLTIAPGSGGGTAVTVTGGAASGATPAGHALNLTGGAASATGGGTAGNAILATGGAASTANNAGVSAIKAVGGAATANASMVAGHGLELAGGAAANNSSANGGDGLKVTGADAATAGPGGIGARFVGGASSTTSGGTAGHAILATGGAASTATNVGGHGVNLIGGAGSEEQLAGHGLLATGGVAGGTNAGGTGGDGVKVVGGAATTANAAGHGFETVGGTAANNAAGTGGDGGKFTGASANGAGAAGVDLRAAITGSITGSLSGSVGSVTGNVGGNVTGSVGSVTGNVGGNVVGSVASVTGNVGGNVVGSVASVTARVTADVDRVDGVALDTHDAGAFPADVRLFGGSAGTFSAGRPEVNTTHLAGTSQTGRDIGASVLLSSGTGTGQLDFTSGVVKANVTQFNGSNATSSSGRPEVNLTHIDAQATTGNNATLNLKQLNIVNSAGTALVASSTGGNGHGIAASGNGSGEGVSSTGGATGHGWESLGGATSGDGVRWTAQTSGQGQRITAAGNNPGMSATGGNGGTLGHGARFVNGTTAGTYSVDLVSQITAELLMGGVINGSLRGRVTGHGTRDFVGLGVQSSGTAPTIQPLQIAEVSGNGFPHGSIYLPSNGKIYTTNITFTPARIVRYNDLTDLNDTTSATFPNDGNHGPAPALTYDDVTNNKLYVNHFKSTAIRVTEVDPTSLAMTLRIDDSSFTQTTNGGIVALGGNLYVLAGTATDSVIAKYSLSTFTLTTSTTLTGLAAGHALATDGTSLFATGGLVAGSSWIAKIDPSAMTYSSATFSSTEFGSSVPTDDMAIANGYVWVGSESATGGGNSIAKVEIADITNITYLHPGVLPQTWGLTSALGYIWAVGGTPGVMVRIDPTTHEMYSYTMQGASIVGDPGFSGPNEVLTDGTHLYISHYLATQKLSKWSVPLPGGSNLTHVDGVAIATHGSGYVPADVRQVDGAALDTHDAGALPADVRLFGGSAGTFSGGRPEVNTTHIAGSSVSTSSAQIGVNVVNAAGTAWNSGAISASTLAADTITDAKVASDVTIASVTGAVGSVTGNVGGNVVGSVASVTAPVTLDNAQGIKRNTATDLFFALYNSSTGAAITGASPSCFVSLDGDDSWSAVAGSVTEVGNGMYRLAANAADVDGANVAFKCTAASARDALWSFNTVLE